MTKELTLLTIKEERICKQLINNIAPHSQRAQALLALNKGHSQTQAAAESGLTPGQVSYWLAKFKQQRISIFPESILNPTEDTSEFIGENTTEVAEVALEADDSSSNPTIDLNNIELPNKEKKNKKKKKKKKKKREKLKEKENKMGKKKKAKKGKKKDLKKGKKNKKGKKGKK